MRRTVPVPRQPGIAKPDMVALAPVARGRALFEVAPSRPGVVLAGIVFALALLAKHSALFGLAAAMLVALARRPRDAVLLAAPRLQRY